MHYPTTHTFLLAAGRALLQQALAVERGQGGGRVLLHARVRLRQRVHGGRAVGHGGRQPPVQGAHTWGETHIKIKTPVLETRIPGETKKHLNQDPPPLTGHTHTCINCSL